MEDIPFDYRKIIEKPRPPEEYQKPSDAPPSYFVSEYLHKTNSPKTGEASNQKILVEELKNIFEEQHKKKAEFAGQSVRSNSQNASPQPTPQSSTSILPNYSQTKEDSRNCWMATDPGEACRQDSRPNGSQHYVSQPRQQISTGTSLIDFEDDCVLVTPKQPLNLQHQASVSSSTPSQITCPGLSPQTTSSSNSFFATPSNLSSGPAIEWVATTPGSAQHLKGRAVVSSGSIRGDLWVIRSWYNGHLIPGKMFIRESMASITYRGKVIKLTVEPIEVLCAQPGKVKWVAASEGCVPVDAIPGGYEDGEVLFIGRGQFKLFRFLAPGKLQPSHRCCYIVFAGKEKAIKYYDVLTKA